MASQLQENNSQNKLTEDMVVSAIKILFFQMTELFIELAKFEVDIEFKQLEVLKNLDVSVVSDTSQEEKMEIETTDDIVNKITESISLRLEDMKQDLSRKITKKALAHILQQPKSLAWVTTKTKFSVFLASPLSAPFFQFTSRISNISPEDWTQIELWFDKERDACPKIWHFRISSIFRFINHLLDEIVLKYMMNPTIISMEKLFLNLISASNLLKTLQLHNVQAFKFLLEIPNEALNCDNVKNLRQIIQKIAGPNFNADSVNYRNDDFTKGQWSLAKIEKSERDKIKTRIDIKNAKFIYAEKFDHFTESYMQELFEKTHQARVARVFSDNSPQNTDSEDEPASKIQHFDSEYDSDDLSYINSLATKAENKT